MKANMVNDPHRRRSVHRKMSAYTGLSNSPLNQRRSRSMSSAELKVAEISESSSRRGSTFFTGPSTGGGGSGSAGGDHTQDEAEHLDYKEQFRNTILQMYAENERIKKQHQIYQENKHRKRKLKDTVDKEQSKLYLCIRYMATEHETLLQFLIFLPLILTALYIVFVEKKPLVK